MAVSKRTRFEVLRRDNHTCRYCGGTAPDVVLTVDHVTPVALGGTDDPSNLVAACKDCNAGKSSSSPDAAMVEDVKQADLKWAEAMQRVADKRAKESAARNAYVARFEATWSRWHTGWDDREIYRPSGWRASVEKFYHLGVPIEEIEHLVNVACGNERIRPDDTFRYFAGCVWRAVTAMQEEAKALLDEADPLPPPDDFSLAERCYLNGWLNGYFTRRAVSLRTDPVASVVDHMTFGRGVGETDDYGITYLEGQDPRDLVARSVEQEVRRHGA